MDIMRAMQHLSNARARQEMQKDPWLKRLDKFLTEAEELVLSADLDELKKMERAGKEIVRIANLQTERILNDDEEEEE